jgi:hypothetical protein
MHSSKEYPLAKIDDTLSVWYAENMYNRHLYATQHTPSAANFRTESFTGKVVNTKWIENNKPSTPYGWLFTVQLEDGSYRSLYECKCTMMQKVKV